MHSKLFLSLFLVATFFSETASARCFRFTDSQPEQIGPVKLWGPADQICYNYVNRIGGGRYYSITFNDKQGVLARLSSATELIGRCPGFCRSYSLTTGSANGVNVNAENTPLEFQIESDRGTVTIGTDRYSVIVD